MFVLVCSCLFLFVVFLFSVVDVVAAVVVVYCLLSGVWSLEFVFFDVFGLLFVVAVDVAIAVAAVLLMLLLLLFFLTSVLVLLLLLLL